ncbi:MAG: lytic transglycosylase domain-containing protein [Alphaproteobacteria bacterium]
MLKKILLTGFAVLFLFGKTADAAAAPFAVIDRVCYNQILDSLTIDPDDITLYKKIFRAIKAEDIDKAEELSEDVENPILMGHVLAEKYLSRTYKSDYAELKSWLEKYSDHPQAARIYALALRKGAKEQLLRPDSLSKVNRTPYSWYNNDYEELPPARRQLVRRSVNSFLKYINQGKTLRARAILENRAFRMAVPDREWDAMAATLTTVYFLDGEDKLALKWSAKPARRSQDATGLWFRGLAFWRQGKYKEAGINFGKLGAKSDNDEWLIAAGAYWAYRAYDKIGDVKQAKKYLNMASKYRRTFYGILANYQLGNPLKYNWDSLAYLNDFSNYNYVSELVASPSIRRAIILIHAKQPELAEKELRGDLDAMNERQREAALFIAQQYNMHSLGIVISNLIKDNDREIYYDCIAYPDPDWQPKSGWRVDRALVWALVRQESGFNAKAQSGAGAKGLMQLMSSTAIYVTKDRRLRRDTSPLFETEYNLETGQRYVSYLMEKDFIGNNLFFLATAYNAGPGNLYKWQKKVKYGNDPLMFIEAIPSRQTRIYIERVLANFWVYNARFGQPSESLEALIHSRWPTL